MKFLHISDTHGYHDLLNIPEDIDMIIHTGDGANIRSPFLNENEFLEFWRWFENLPVKYKVFTPGNHDSFLEHSISKIFKKSLKENCYILINESIEIEGIKIWGSPFTPMFNNWSFMRNRDKLFKLWETIPEDIDILLTHGPPKRLLDLSINRQHIVESVGCNALRKVVLKIQPKYHLFGHVHNCEDIINAGILKLSSYKTIFSNGSVVTDGKFGKLTSNGNIFNY